MRVTVIATGFEAREEGAVAPKAEAAAEPMVKTGDVGDIDAIFDIFKR